MCIGKVPRLASWDWFPASVECDPRMGSPTRLGDPDWEDWALESLMIEEATVDETGKELDGWCWSCCWDDIKGMMEGVGGSTAGLGRKRWAKLDIEIISTVSLD
jgi:hypothetical protein